ncbi:MAG: HAD family hydrolase [Nitrospinae bacterium]|nr:HAD family hydrolase [Nitrospinota bacterium]
MKKIPTAIILDFDGVILDSSALKTDAFREFYSYFPSVFDDIMNFHLKNKGISRYEQFSYLCELLKIPKSRQHVEKFAADFSKLIMDKLLKCPFILGAVEFIEAFYKQVPLSIASNSPHDELLHVIDIKNIGKYFKNIEGNTGNGDKKAILTKILIQNTYQAATTLYIGDTLKDYEAALSVGVGFIGINNPLVIFPANILNFNNLIQVKDYLLN